jgi:hypothetical protein
MHLDLRVKALETAVGDVAAHGGTKLAWRLENDPAHLVRHG